MFILAINTASSITSIALFQQESKVLLKEKSWKSEKNEAEKILPEIEKLLGKGKNFTNITEIYVIKGPGSFTGLRIGISIANTIAWLNKANLFGIITFEYWESFASKPLLVFAGAGAVYFKENSDEKPEIIKIEELNEFLNKKNIKEVFGDISEEQKLSLKSIKFNECEKTFGELMLEIIKKSDKKPVKLVEPLYIKQPGITQPKSSTPSGGEEKSSISGVGNGFK